MSKRNAGYPRGTIYHAYGGPHPDNPKQRLARCGANRTGSHRLVMVLGADESIFRAPKQTCERCEDLVLRDKEGPKPKAKSLPMAQLRVTHYDLSCPCGGILGMGTYTPKTPPTGPLRCHSCHQTCRLPTKTIQGLP